MTIYETYSPDNYYLCGKALREAAGFLDSSEKQEEKRAWLVRVGISKIGKKSVMSKDVFSPSINHRVRQVVGFLERYCIRYLRDYQIDSCAGRAGEFNDGEQLELKLNYPPPKVLIGNRVGSHEIRQMYRK